MAKKIRRKRMRTFVWGILGFLVLGIGASAGAPEEAGGEELDVDEFLSELDEFLAGEDFLAIPETPGLWDSTVTLRSSFGYRDNIFFSSVNPRSSVLALAGVEYFLLRTPGQGVDFYLFALAENMWFFENSAPDERLGMLVAEAKKRNDAGWTAGGLLQAYYSEQVMDVSTEQVELGVIALKGGGATVSPFVRKEIGGVELEGGFSGAAHFFRSPLDDYTEMGPKLAARFGERSRFEVSYEWLRRDYDGRLEVDREGVALEGTELVFEIQRVRGSWTRDWGAEGRWRTKTELDFRINEDTGSGFYDYTEYGIRQGLRYERGLWEIGGTAGASRHEYDVQTGRPEGTGLRKRTTWEWEARVRRRLSESVSVTLDFSREEATEDERLGDYHVDMVLAGIHWEL